MNEAPYRISDEELFGALAGLKYESSTDDPAYIFVVNVLWERYLPLCYKLTNSYKVRKDKQYEFRAFGEDLLRDCIEKFEPRASFFTYYKRILLTRASTFLRQMESVVHVPDDALHFSGRRNATAKAKETEKERVRLGRTSAVSPKPLYNEDNTLAVDVADDAPNPEEIMIAKDLERKLSLAMEKLSDLDKEIVRRVNDGETFTDIGRSLMLSDKQTSRRYKAALAIMRAFLDRRTQ